ncbi:Golgi-associated RAB2 interactor protein 5B [Acomys russatus]|uniref:Golgi-associated RAB2 interactor protein 5B n=1 Tax=Acomys russatus TaxID=60746 RepID=UPI0021E2B4C5|nr:Golgi-associated RAB2 interactor protein 5B [Acomys russatus]
MKRLLNIRRTRPPQDPQKWVPILGELQKTLQKGEYLPLRPLPMFESNFVQVTNHGAPAFVHHRTNKLTMGVAASLPGLVLPDILLLARPPEGKECSNLNLTRLIPLDLAHLYVHDPPTWRLKLRLITGRYYYLELDAPDHELDFLFDRWIRLINLLHEPSISWAPRTIDTPPLDSPKGGVPASTWRHQAQSPDRFTVEVAQRTFPYKIASQKQRKVKATKHTLRSRAVGDSLPLVWSQLQPPEGQMKATEKKSYLDACPDGSNELIHVSEKANISIRTIFSIISGTMHQAHGSASEGATGRSRLLETPTQCISHDNCELPFVDSCDAMDAFLWRQDLEDLIDTNSTTLSSPLHTSSYPTTFYVFPPSPPSFLTPNDKVRPTGSVKYRGPLSSRKSASAPTTSGKMPFILDQSNKVQAEPAPTQKVPALPAPSRKVPPALLSTRKSSAVRSLFDKAPPSLSQKAPPVPGHPRKAPVLIAPPQKTLPLVQKLPEAPTGPQKAMPPKKDYLVRNTQFRKAPTAQYQKALDSQAKAPVDPTVLQVGDTLQRKSEGKQEPVLLVGGQKTKVIDMRAQNMSLHLPSTTTKKESKEILISRTQEVTLEALKGRERSADWAHKMKEETTVNRPDLKSKEIGSQKKWVLTRDVAVEGPRTDDNRPFSVQGLTLAKMMIMANSKHQHLKPATISLPSWLSMDSRGSAMTVLANLPFNTSQMTLPEGPKVVVQEQSGSCAKVKEKNTEPLGEKKPPEDSLRTSRKPIVELPVTSTSDSMLTTMPTSGLEDMSQPLTSFTTSSSDQVPQKPGEKHPQLEKTKAQPQPLAATGSNSEQAEGLKPEEELGLTYVERALFARGQNVEGMKVVESGSVLVLEATQEMVVDLDKRETAPIGWDSRGPANPARGSHFPHPTPPPLLVPTLTLKLKAPVDSAALVFQLRSSLFSLVRTG